MARGRDLSFRCGADRGAGDRRVFHGDGCHPELAGAPRACGRLMRSPGHTAFALYKRLLLQARPYWPHVVGVFLLNLLSTPLALLTPLPMKIVLDSAFDSRPLPGPLEAFLPATAAHGTSALIVAAVLSIGVSLLVRLQGNAAGFLQSYTGAKLVLGLRARLFDHAQ